MSDPMTAPSRITALFDRLGAENRAAFIPYITAGDPDLETSFAILCGLAEGGADVIELGVPFSDPMADGEVIQAAMLRALNAGTTLKKVLALVRRFRERHDTPLVLFGYLNPLYRHGLDAVARDAKDAGVDGMLVVDLPPEEADQLVTPLAAHGLDFIALFTPTSDKTRIAAIGERASGFAYYVSMTGITGDKLSAFAEVQTRVNEVSSVVRIPVAVGFGIQTEDDARAVARFARGVVVGTALVRELAGVGAEEAGARARAFAERFATALAGVST
jgi:tryptophan synthase alpha chain